MHFAEAFATTRREQPIRYAADAHDLDTWHRALLPERVRFTDSTRDQRRSAQVRNSDRLPRLVFADWLDERGYAAYADVVRRHAEAASRDVSDEPPAATNSYHFTERDHNEHDGDDLPDVERHPPGSLSADAWTAFHRGRGIHGLTAGFTLPADADSGEHRYVYHTFTAPEAEVAATLQRLREEGFHVADSGTNRRLLSAERPVQHKRDGDPLIRRKLNSKHQKNRAERNRKLTPAELAAKIRDLVVKTPRTLSKVQSALRLDGATTAAAIQHGEESGLLKTVPTARGRRVEPHSGTPPHTTSSASDSMDTSAHYAREFARHFAAYRAPEGGVSVKGLYYPGGQLVPDLTKFAAEPKVAEEVAMAPAGSFKGSQQFAPVRDAEPQVIRPRGGDYRGSKQLQVLPPRPNGLRMVEPATPKPEPRPLPSLSKRIAGSGSVGSRLTRPMKPPPPRSAPPPKPKPKAAAKPKDDGVPIRRRTANPSLLDKLRRLIAKNLQPTRYSRGDHSHEAFHAAIRSADPMDRLPSLVYADWLDEQGQSAHAEIVRRHQQRAETQNAPAYHSHFSMHHDNGAVSVQGYPLGDSTQYAVQVGLTSPENGDRSSHYVYTSHEDAQRLLSQLESEGVVNADLARIRLDRHVARNSAPAA